MAPPQIHSRLHIFISSFVSILFTISLLVILNPHAAHAITPLASLPSLDPSTAFPPPLQKRQSSCTTSGNTRCPSPASRFCCSNTAECIPLNNATSVICCPSGEDCSFIQPITCSSSLSTCGSNSQCCPAGYDCDTASGGCKLQDHNIPASYRLRDECAKLNPKDGDRGTSQTCTALIEATKKSCVQACEQFPVKGIVTGFFPGLAVGAAVMFLVGLWMRRREKKAIDAASATGRGGRHGGGGGGVAGRSGGGESRSIGRHINTPGEYKDKKSVNVKVLSVPGSGFAAARASKRVTTGGVTAVYYGSGGGYAVSPGRNARSHQRARSAGATTMMSSTEIAIGYDRRQDEQFSLVCGSGRGTPANGIFTSPTPPPLTSSIPLTRSPSGAGGTAVGRAARGYNCELRSPRHFIPEELSGGAPSIEHPAVPPSSQPLGGGGAAAATVSAAARRTTTSTLPIPPPRSRMSPSPVASPSGGSTSTPLVPLAASTARKPLPAPLTHEHLLQHQQQHQQQHLMGPIAPKAQSEYRSEDASSFAPTSLSYSDDGSSDDQAVGRGVGGRSNYHRKPPASEISYQRLATNAIDPSTSHHRRKKPRRPPSDVTSCITDGDHHDDGLTAFSEPAAAGVLTSAHHGVGIGAGGMEAVKVSQAGTKSTSVADRESVAANEGSPFVEEGDREREERVAVDWGVPPPLPEGYGYEYSEAGARRVVAKYS